jgi:hypothetical protein
MSNFLCERPDFAVTFSLQHSLTPECQHFALPARTRHGAYIYIFAIFVSAAFFALEKAPVCQIGTWSGENGTAGKGAKTGDKSVDKEQV